MTIPSAVDELTPEWFTEVLNTRVDEVHILDAHSGTTGRARVELTASSHVPETVFVKLQPFAARARTWCSGMFPYPDARSRSPSGEAAKK